MGKNDNIVGRFLWLVPGNAEEKQKNKITRVVHTVSSSFKIECAEYSKTFRKER